MAQSNGVKSPPARENSLIGKRKRAVANEEMDNNPRSKGADDNNPAFRPDPFQELLVDILEVLRSYDTSPSILQHPISSSGKDLHAVKRTKTSLASGNTTLTAMVEAKLYANITEFVKDVDSAVAGVIQVLKDKTEGQPSSEDVLREVHNRTESMRAIKFKKRLDSIVSREMVLRPKAFSPLETQVQNGVQQEVTEEANTNTSEPSSCISSHRQVLTLFGSAPNARQLFSSFQQPNETRDTMESKPLREWGLPNGITTTRVVPVHSYETKKDSKVPTLGELFPQPTSLAQLNPPRQSKHTATRSASVSWINAADSSATNRSYRRDSYATQALATGQWLKYNVPPSPSQLATPEAKRKQRDRALSFGEPQPTLPQETMDAHNEKKEDALFRSVYSSFAPSTDNTGATVSQRTKERLWWEKVGERKYQDSCTPANFEYDIDNESAVETVDEMDTDHLESDPFKEIVDTWEPEEHPAFLDEAKKDIIEQPETTQEVDEILQEISELLETLNSYQRIRHLSLSNNARAATGQNNSISGTPSSPSPAEFDLYNILKSQLSIMVSSLPPWALARVNGEKLGNLNISTKLQAEGETFKGTVDEEELGARAKQTSTPSLGYPRTTNAPATVPARSTYASTATQPYQRPSYAPQTGARPTTNPSSYLPNQQYSARPASASQYLGASRPSYAPRPVAASTERYNYTASQQYNPQAHSTPSGYTNNNRSYSTQNVSYYGNQYAQSTPSQAQRPSQPVYQPRPVDAITYDYRASAGKAGSPPQANTAYSPPQRSFAGINTASSQSRPNLYQNSPSYSQTTSNAINGVGSSYAAYRSANEQAAFMNRQRTQLDEPQRQTPIRQTSGTPQPANGITSAQQSRTGTPQQNGVTAGTGQS
ncbi:MAG: hypothetical protein Q9195_007316 [Heterodermia aff. obscurata]